MLTPSLVFACWMRGSIVPLFYIRGVVNTKCALVLFFSLSLGDAVPNVGWM